MKIGKINQTNFKGLYEIKSKTLSATAKAVPAENHEKDSVKLEFAHVIYRPFMGEKLDLEKIKSKVSAGALEHGYTAPGDHYYLNAVVPEVYLGKTLNFTQDEWERVTGKNIEDVAVTKETLIEKLEDKGNYITEMSQEEADAIKTANNFNTIYETSCDA